MFDLVELKTQHELYLHSLTQPFVLLWTCFRLDKRCIEGSSEMRNIFVQSYVKIRQKAPRAINPP